METYSIAFVMLVVSGINLLLSLPYSDQIPTITTLGLSENVTALQQSILLCSVQVPGEVQWSLYIYKGRGGGLGWDILSLHVAKAKSRSKLLWLKHGRFTVEPRGLRMIDICKQGRNTQASSCSFVQPPEALDLALCPLTSDSFHQ